MKFYVTFGVQYNDRDEIHPKGMHCDGWCEIEAPDAATARKAAFYLFDQQWSIMYEPWEWIPDRFPRGCLMTWDTDNGSALHDPAELNMQDTIDSIPGDDRDDYGEGY